VLKKGRTSICSGVKVGRRAPTVSIMVWGYEPLKMGSKNQPYQKSGHDKIIKNMDRVSKQLSAKPG